MIINVFFLFRLIDQDRYQLPIAVVYKIVDKIRIGWIGRKNRLEPPTASNSSFVDLLTFPTRLNDRTKNVNKARLNRIVKRLILFIPNSIFYLYKMCSNNKATL